ncbi:hypothetical protein [Motiliproteus sp.]|uniref:hypothetical protein n=1 Tax=Motiliproteus sp. TaxID=1898955 RepID=UPI003BAD0381
MDKLEILWTPQGTNLPSLGARALTDISDGDTPNIRMPIRMLSIDTPETTARSAAGAAKIDAQFQQLAGWIQAGQAPVSDSFAQYILPKLADIDAGTLQFQQGKQAGEHYQQLIDQRLTKPSGSKRKLFVRSPEPPFDGYGRLLAYVSPSYSTREIATLSRVQRATFNLNMVESGWAAPFILFPNIPGERDLPLFVEQALAAKNAARGQYQEPLSLPGYEYRMCEKLYSITQKLVNGERLNETRRNSWRSRYCADMRDRRLYGPTVYMQIPEPYRLWIWPDDLQRSISRLNLIPVSG